MISIENLSKHFGAHRVLTNINLHFEAGKVYGIVGENGAGKTTLFKCIAGLEKYEGTITSEKKTLKNHLGFLQTDLYFFPRITGMEYLRLLCKARNVSIFDFEEKNIFDLPLHQYATTYSTGMKKKLALMAILLQGNDFFILDEPFNGVDIQSNMLIMEIILELKSKGKVVIVSSHIFSTLHDTCDEIHLLKEGVIAQTVAKKDFHLLEQQMKDFVIGDRIAKLGLI
jgi:ABC-2 type transport system ATP-binding protein